MATENVTPTSDHPDWCDPFPEVTTFPSGWDLGDVLALERERMEAKEGDGDKPGFPLTLAIGVHAYQDA